MAVKKNYNSDGKSAEDRTLDKFAELLIRGDCILSQEPERKGIQRNEQHDVDVPCREGGLQTSCMGYF